MILSSRCTPRGQQAHGEVAHLLIESAQVNSRQMPNSFLPRGHFAGRLGLHLMQEVPGTVWADASIDIELQMTNDEMMSLEQVRHSSFVIHH